VVYEIRASGRTRRWTTAPPERAACATALTRALETSAIRRANHVFTICEGLRADIVARGISANHVTVIPNAVDVDAFHWHSLPIRPCRRSGA
jgi:glycogen(starch) synthase